MKTFILISIISLLSFSASEAKSGFFGSFIGDEAYVNDFPLNTTALYKSYMEKLKCGTSLSKLPDEAFVEDVPFNTGEIASKYQTNQKVQYTLPAISEEVALNDEPVDTRAITASYMAAQKMKAIRLQPEPYVNDVPLTLVPVQITCNTKLGESPQYVVNLNLDNNVELLSVEKQGNRVRIVFGN